MLLEEFLKIDPKNLVGKVICFPTDTVYGVGCMISDMEATKKIYQIKNRDLDKPLAVLVPSPKSIAPYVNNVSDKAYELMEKYWPGALTIIFDMKPGLNIPANKGLSTIGLRMPNSHVALGVLNHLGLMATTSVNISGNEPLNSITEIKKVFGDQIDYYIEDNPGIISKKSSTVISLKDDKITVLRQGDIKFEEN